MNKISRIIFISILTISAIILLLTSNRAKDIVTVNHGQLPKKIYSDRPLVSPNGKIFAILGNNKVTIWDIKGRQLGTFIDPKPYINPPNNFKFWNPNRYITAIGFLPDNKHLAIAVFQRTIHIVNLSGKIIKTIKVPLKKMGAASGGWSYITKIIYFPDGKRLITYEPGEIDIVVRTSDYKMIKRIRMKYGSWAFGFPEIKIHPSGKYFVTLQDMATPSKDGWNSILKLFNRNGKFIRDLETDKPGRIATPDGRFKKDFFKPKNFHFSPDGKHITYLQDYISGTIYDPLGRTYDDRGRQKKIKITQRIRKTNIFTGKQFEIWITNKHNINLKDINFSQNGKSFIAADSTNIFSISLKGDLLKSVKNEKMKYFNGKTTYNYNFSVNRFLILRNSKKIIGFCYSPAAGIIIYNFNGEKNHFIQSENLIPENIYCSHYGKFLSFEFERAKKSYLFNTKKNIIVTKQASIYFDNNNRIYSLSRRYEKKRKSFINTITFNNRSEIYTEQEHRICCTIPFPNHTFADTYNKFTLFDKNGEAIRRYPYANIGLNTAVHPNLKYYISPSTSAKYKTVQVYNLFGKKIKEWYLGAFFTFTYTISPGTLSIAAGHDKSGYIQVWNKNGKLLHRFSDLHATEVKGIALTKNDRFVISSEADGTIMITNLETNKRLMITLYPDNKFIASDSIGRYDCSNDLIKHVTITYNGIVIAGSKKEKLKTANLIWKFLTHK